MDEVEDELKQLHKQYWLCERELYRLECEMPSWTLLGKAYRTTRAEMKESSRHLLPVLRSACAGNGGCCGRSCGCCERPRTTDTDSTMRWGHCTLDCGCCIRTRGFDKDELTPEEQWVNSQFHFTDKTIWAAYIFGLDVSWRFG